MAGAADGRAFGSAQEFIFFPGEQFGQRGVIQIVAGTEIRFVVALCELVPRAYQLAVVAAEDAVAHRCAQFFGNRAAQFDRQVADAAPRIDAIRRDDRLRRADLDAAGAGAAMRAGFGIGGQWQIGEQFAQKEP